MSIIYEALKKVEQAQLSDAGVKASTKSKLAKSKLKPYLLYLLVIGLGLFITNTIFGLLTQKPAALKLTQSAPLPAAQPEPISQVRPELSLPAVPEPTPEAFVLNGIFFSEDEGYALINNQIVKAGDAIGGAKVKRIDIDAVELESADETIKLSTVR